MSAASRSSAPVSQKRPRLSTADYTIACVCPMGVELAPLRALLDTIHDDLPSQRNHNAYTLGELEQHNVVIAVLPETGNNSAGIAAAQILKDYPSIQLVLLVGIGGGVPGNGRHDDIRLGDVVVSQPTDTKGGVIQFDRGKSHGENDFERTGHLNKPPPFLCATVETLKAKHRQEGNQINSFMSDMLRRNPYMKSSCTFPGYENDQLYESHYLHVSGETCESCDAARIRVREARRNNQIRVHYGTIGSSNCVIKSATERDRLKETFNLLCVEMEAAGLMDAFPCLVIRGICDYADSHKNKRWQPFAAATAAAYAKELLRIIPPKTQFVSHAPSLSTNGGHDNLVNVDSPFQHSDGPDPTSRHEALLADDETKYKRLVDSLAFERMDARLLNITNALSQTCRWIFKDAKFKTWLEQDYTMDHHGFLWIKGKPGSGKSTMMKVILEMIKKVRSGDITVFYFFNARAPSTLEKSSLGMYRSLVCQLLQKCAKIKPLFIERFDSKDRGSIEDWTSAELQGFLHEISEALERPLNILVDALDEGDESDVRQLISFLEDMSLTAFENRKPLKICLSSRHYPRLSLRRGLSLILENQDGHGDDIAKYVQNKLIGEGNQIEILRDRLCQKSSRVFLWIVLVVPMLNQAYDRGQITEMEKLIERLPPELDQLFASILSRNNEGLESTVLLLQWVSFAIRPLSPVELYLATQLGLPNLSVDWIMLGSGDYLNRFLLDRSRGLTEVTRTNPPSVQFIHETVREYLIREHGLAKIDMHLAGNVEGLSHDRLRSGCLRYIDECLPNMSIPKGQREAEEVRRDYLFSDYAISYVFLHADLSRAEEVSQKKLLERFQHTDFASKWIHYRNAFQRHKVRKYTERVQLLYICAEQNLPNIAKELIDTKADVNAIGERYGNALQATCVSGHEEMVRLLINNRARVDTADGEHKYALCAALHGKHKSIMQFLQRQGKLPPIDVLERQLFIAIARGFLSGVEFLIENGVSPSCLNSRGETTLYFAIDKNKPTIADLLILRGADVNVPNSDGRVALHAAIDTENEQMIRRILKGGAHVNVHSDGYGIPLLAAVRQSYELGAGLLVENGADVNAKAGVFGNALYAAVSSGHEQLSRLLIENGADVNAQGGTYGNALQAAVVGSYEQLCRLLIENGADVNAQRGLHGNALFAAIFKSHQGIAKMLIENGANVNAYSNDNFFGFALQAAVVEPNEDIVRLLIEKGADVNAQGGHYGCALRAALYMIRNAEDEFFWPSVSNRYSISQHLIKSGADVARFNEEEKHVFGYIVNELIEQGFDELTRFLIDKGANVNVFSPQGTHDFALSAAVARGNMDYVRLLLDHGANVNASSLKMAISLHHDRIARLLIERGADVTDIPSEELSRLQEA